MRWATFFSLLAVFCFSFLGFSGFLYAQVASVVPPTDGEFFKAIADLVVNFKGQSPYVIAFAISKLLIMALDAPFLGKFFSKLSSSLKFTVASGLSYISAVLSLVVSGMSLGNALINGVTVPLFVAFAHLVYKYYIEKKTPSQLLAKADAIEAQARKIQQG